MSKNSKKTGESNYNNLDFLIGEMKKRDEHQKKTFKRFSVMLSVFTVLYFILLVINPDPELRLTQRISGICYVVAFLTGVWFFRKEHKSMMQINYSASLLDVMKGAVERYRPFRKGFLSYLPVLIFIDLGLTLGGPSRYMPDGWSKTEKILYLQLFYWSIMLVAGFISFILWNKRVKPYRDAVNKMISELDFPDAENNEKEI